MTSNAQRALAGRSWPPIASIAAQSARMGSVDPRRPRARAALHLVDGDRCEHLRPRQEGWEGVGNLPTVAEPLQPCFGKLWAAGCGTLEGRSPRARGPRARALSAGTARRAGVSCETCVPGCAKCACTASIDAAGRNCTEALRAMSPPRCWWRDLSASVPCPLVGEYASPVLAPNRACRAKSCVPL